jgi:hypothetical protein
MMDRQGYMHALVRTCPRFRAHARTHERAHTHKYEILIGFPRQEWFRERASILRYSYIASFVEFPHKLKVNNE